MKNALVINPNSIIGLAVIRQLIRLGYTVTTAAPRSSSYEPTLISDTNPEFELLPKLAVFDDVVIDSPDEIIEQCHLEEIAPIDVVIDLNPTEQSFIKWDLNLLYALLKRGFLSEKDGIVVVGRDSEQTTSTENLSLEKTLQKMAPEFTGAGISFNDYTQVGSISGDEAYVAGSYTMEVVRNGLKVEKVNSLETLLNYVLYYYVPGFLLGFVLHFKSLIGEYLPFLSSILSTSKSESKKKAD